MNVIEALAIVNQAASTLGVLAPILQRMHAEGREDLTPDELAQVRAITLASEQRLEAATQ